VQAALQEEIDLIKSEGVTADELERAQNGWQKSFYQRMESVSGRGGMLHMYSNYVGEPDFAQGDLERYLGVTADSLSKWTNAVLDDSKRIELIVRPAPPAEDAPTDGAAPEGGAQ
jgi:predicted Zn-dependent peptidase